MGGGLLTVTRKNAVASVMWLIVAFLGMSTLFLGMDAGFIGVIQILVYAGAIMILFLFVIMLLNLTPSGLLRIDRPRGTTLGLAAAAALSMRPKVPAKNWEERDAARNEPRGFHHLRRNRVWRYAGQVI